MLLHTYFYNISLIVLRPIFVIIYNLPFLCTPNIGKIGVKVGPKTNYFSSFMSSCTNRIAVFNNFFFTNIWPTKRQTKPCPRFPSFQIFFELSLSYRSSLSVHYPETFPKQNSSTHENCNIKFPLNIFSDQITICQISFEIFDVKQIDTRAKK